MARARKAGNVVANVRDKKVERFVNGRISEANYETDLSWVRLAVRMWDGVRWRSGGSALAPKAMNLEPGEEFQ